MRRRDFLIAAAGGLATALSALVIGAHAQGTLPEGPNRALVEKTALNRAGREVHPQKYSGTF